MHQPHQKHESFLEKQKRRVAQRMLYDSRKKYLMKLRRNTWTLLEDPHSSPAAKMFAYICMMMIFVSTVTYCMETMLTSEESRTSRILFFLETIVIIWFTMEYLLRCVSAEHFNSFFFSFMGLLDFCVIAPYYITLVLQKDMTRKVLAISVVRLMRMIRVIRIFKMTRYNRGLAILWVAIRESLAQLTALILFLLMAIILWSSLLFYLEHDHHDESIDIGFSSIPIRYD